LTTVPSHSSPGGGSLLRSRTLLLAGFWLTVAVVWAQFISTSFRVAHDFPLGYSWSEMLVNYQGGFVRRGLFGEILYRLDDLVSVRFLMPAIVCLLYLATMTWLVVLAFRIGTFAALLFLFSPGTVIFPIYEYVAFARKDVFVFAALMAAAAIAVYAPRRYALAMLMAVYFVAGLFVEVAWFYFPLAVAMFLNRQGEGTSTGWQVATMVAADAYLLACLAFSVLIGVGTPAMVDAIVASWQAKHPGAFDVFYRPNFLFLTFRQGLQMVIDRASSARTASGQVLGFVLTAAPLVLLVNDLKQRTKPGFLIRLWTFGSFCAMALAYAVGADWGRYTHFFAIHTFVYLAVTREPRPRPPPAPGNEGRENLVWIACALVLLLYATTWRLAHVVPAGELSIYPGSLQRLFGAVSPVFDRY